MSEVEELIDGLFRRCGIERVAALPPRRVRFRRLRLLWLRFRIWRVMRRMRRLAPLFIITGRPR